MFVGPNFIVCICRIINNCYFATLRSIKLDVHFFFRVWDSRQDYLVLSSRLSSFIKIDYLGLSSFNERKFSAKNLANFAKNLHRDVTECFQ